MIHKLPTPFKGATHVFVGLIREAPESRILVTYKPGTLNEAGEWVPDPYLPELTRSIVGEELEALLAGAAAAHGVPPCDGAREWRKADVVAFLDAHGWEPR